jgi:hypothetical protein
MAHFDNVHRWSIVSIFAFLYRLGQNQPAVQIFDTHKKAHIKWASSDFIIMFWCGRLPYNEGRLIACNYYCCFTLRPLASHCFWKSSILSKSILLTQGARILLAKNLFVQKKCDNLSHIKIRYIHTRKFESAWTWFDAINGRWKFDGSNKSRETLEPFVD